MEDEEHVHEGTFAEGQEREKHHPEREPRGRFADDEKDEEHRHEGTFGAGQERDEHHPERERHGDFAEGQET